MDRIGPEHGTSKFTAEVARALALRELRQGVEMVDGLHAAARSTQYDLADVRSLELAAERLRDLCARYRQNFRPTGLIAFRPKVGEAS